jgi:hypothetical protein
MQLVFLYFTERCLMVELLLVFNFRMYFWIGLLVMTTFGPVRRYKRFGGIYRLLLQVLQMKYDLICCYISRCLTPNSIILLCSLRSMIRNVRKVQLNKLKIVFWMCIWINWGFKSTYNSLIQTTILKGVLNIFFKCDLFYFWYDKIKRLTKNCIFKKSDIWMILPVQL